MPKVPELSPSKRGRIVQQVEDGIPYRQIAQERGCSIGTISKTMKRHREHNTRNTLSRSGRPNVLDQRTRQCIIRTIKANRVKTYHDIAEMVGEVTEHQVQQAALEAGFARRVARKKPFIHPNNINKRLGWGKKNVTADWKKWIWTDEFTVELGKPQGRKFVTRQPGEEFLPECIHATHRSGRQSQMFWACIGYDWKGPLVVLKMSEPKLVKKRDGTMKKVGGGFDGPCYVEQILEGPLKRVWDEKTAFQEGWGIVEDGAGAHRSALAKKARERLGIQKHLHIADSPDLNAAEPLWQLIKARLWQIPGAHSSLPKMIEAVKQIWDEITPEDIMKHTSHMQDRVDQVLSAKGWHTAF